MNITNVSACGLNKPQVLVIGRQLEDNYRQFVFDCSDFGVEVTSITLVHQRSQDVAPYLVDTSSTDSLTWTATETDTSYAGYGKAELRISFSNGLAKSVVFTTMVLASITADTVIPTALQSWYDAMIDYIDEHSISPEELGQAIEDYLEEHPITAPVDSVNGKTGAVVLNASDVHALPDSTVIPTVPTNVSAFQNDAGYINASQAPVQSVNGQTGAVVIHSSGLTQAQINALDGLFRAIAYAEDATAEYADFCTAFGIVRTYSITNTLTNVTNSNTAASITDGSSYSGTLTADTGYSIDMVTVTMGGTDITSTAYNAGSINISSVTGNLIITASASGGGGRSDMNGWTDGVAYTDLEIVQNEYVDNADGSFDPYDGWNRTGYVPIDGASSLTIPQMSGYGGASRYNAFYTQNHTFISAFAMEHTQSVTVTVPSNAYYFVLSETASQLNQILTDGVVPNA